MMIFKGLPASGKSTEATALVKREPGRWIRINRDDLRGMAVGPGNNPHGDRDREDIVRLFKEELIRVTFKKGYDVILDDTHLITATVKKLHELAASIGDVKVIEKGINVSVDECIRRDSLRPGFAKVGEKVITDFARAAGLDKGRKLNDKEVYYAPRWLPGGVGAASVTKQPRQDLPKAIMCDLDGTLAIIDGRSPYDASNCDEKDKPNWPVIETVLAMHRQGVKVIFMSGRDVKYRPETERFIEKYCRDNHGRSNFDGIPIPYELHMRGELDLSKTDVRKDSVIKEELYIAHIDGKYNVLFVLDDRDQVVDQWRSMGLTCFQVAPGSF